VLSQDEIMQIVKNVDYAGNGKINYSEFLAATIEIK
jgi:Ca2+-binding EF-hand superfamily protein